MQGFVNSRLMIVESLSARIPQLLSTGAIIGFNYNNFSSKRDYGDYSGIFDSRLVWYSQWSLRHGLSSVNEYRYAQEYISSTSTTSPEVNVRCALAQNISTDGFSVTFPAKTWAFRDLGPSYEGSPEWYEGGLPFNISASDPKFFTKSCISIG